MALFSRSFDAELVKFLIKEFTQNLHFAFGRFPFKIDSELIDKISDVVYEWYQENKDKEELKDYLNTTLNEPGKYYTSQGGSNHSSGYFYVRDLDKIIYKFAQDDYLFWLLEMSGLKHGEYVLKKVKYNASNTYHPLICIDMTKEEYIRELKSFVAWLIVHRKPTFNALEELEKLNILTPV